MAASVSYLLCGTPRTGSTLLCSLLSSTGVAGRPESYFREPEERMWAERFGTTAIGESTPDYRRFVAAAEQAGATPNGVFAARIMWGTMHALVERLDPRRGGRSDVQVLTDALGPLRFVHLQRLDVVAQAVSWARAEQTGYWQHGDVRAREPRFDLDQVDGLIDTIRGNNSAWRAWFADQGVEPVDVTYERVVAAPSDTVGCILDAIGTKGPAGWMPASPHGRQADAINADWVQRHRAAQAGLTAANDVSAACRRPAIGPPAPREPNPASGGQRQHRRRRTWRP